ncbi:substrate-binding domain-containing protein [Bacillus sonorensis]|uniref:ABC transporter substrate-binding protein n=1 Tax=Bacillus sonorensis L12 TaxID=1274524 RepID=M5PDP6_9BACI|nr:MULTISPECIES: substrate-binding domain-containing protein [Bacillus]EME73967.1 ABC transporter substrate-binding protein [Bacillus sonorensis L12]MCF7619867.1 substrate-binding domain-containing protein [Bacillus sonorensis]MCY7858284.1 substrate-binding domain-containing protein [Bacillus sonorensis]MCY8027601.1 substrate-binding domain-containing protein [Bacillus sonorensis]MCY8035443.1 substrate-binding domain-containing protein [Bacillus sonorensis]
MKKLLALYAVMLCLFFVYVYDYSHSEKAGSNEGEESGPLAGSLSEKYVMVTFQSGIEYWKSGLKGFEDAAQLFNVSVEYRGAAHYDAHEQTTVLEQVIAKKPAGIAVSAIDPEALNPVIDKAREQGIPVVLFDSDAPLSNASTYIGTNNREAGAAAAREMAKFLEGKGETAVITQPNQYNHQERTKGFRKTIEQSYPNMKVSAVLDGKGDELTSKKAAEALLKQNPRIKGIFTTEANGASGVAQAVETAGLKGKVNIIGFDKDKKTLDGITDGSIAATLGQDTWQMGYWSLHMLFFSNHHLKKPRPLPSSIDTGITIITKENVEAYYAND